MDSSFRAVDTKQPTIVKIIDSLEPFARLIEKEYRIHIDSQPCVGWLPQLFALVSLSKQKTSVKQRLDLIFLASSLKTIQR